MHTFKILIMAVLASTVLCNNSKASVKLTFDENEFCSVECDNVKKEFNSLADLKQNINDITGQYFTILSISKIDKLNTIILHGFENKNTNVPYTLSIHGSICFHPYIVLNYMQNVTNIPIINLECITTLKIYSSQFTYPKSGSIQYTDLDKILFNDKPISYFPTIKVISNANSIKPLVYNAITKFVNYSNAIVLMFIMKYIAEIIK